MQSMKLLVLSSCFLLLAGSSITAQTPVPSDVRLVLKCMSPINPSFARKYLRVGNGGRVRVRYLNGPIPNTSNESKGPQVSVVFFGAHDTRAIVHWAFVTDSAVMVDGSPTMLRKKNGDWEVIDGSQSPGMDDSMVAFVTSIERQSVQHILVRKSVSQESNACRSWPNFE
jgi:hypothetical protein